MKFSRKQWLATPAGKAAHRRAVAKYSASPKGKATHKRYNSSPTRKVVELCLKYGITQEFYNTLMVSQRHVCAICENSAKLVIDHDHITGKVRGLLCNSCNTGIGFLGDSPKRLKKAITYLRKPQK